MPWARFDDHMPSHRKIRALSDAAFRLWVSSICWSNANKTDGFIAEDELAFVSDVESPSGAVPELVRRGLWEVVGGGWLVHDFHDYNPSVERVSAERELKSERQRRWREKRRGLDGRFGQDAAVDASPVGGRDAANDAAPVPARPGPTPNTPSPSTTEETGRSRRRSHPAEVLEAESFAAFWAIYPRKQGKGSAEKAWNSVVRRGTVPRRILDGARRYAGERVGQDAKYTKHPSTWLNGRCWEDEPDPVYRPAVIGAPSEAAAAYPPPIGIYLADLEAHRTGRDRREGEEYGRGFRLPE